MNDRERNLRRHLEVARAIAKASGAEPWELLLANEQREYLREAKIFVAGHDALRAFEGQLIVSKQAGDNLPEPRPGELAAAGGNLGNT